MYFSQYDSRWGGLMYGLTNTIAGAGCGPTSLAICVSTLTDTVVTPPEVCDWSVKTGHRCEGSGSYHSLIPDGAAHYNVPCRGIGQNGNELVKALQDGKLVIRDHVCRAFYPRRGTSLCCAASRMTARSSFADCASLWSAAKRNGISAFFLAECNKGAAGPARPFLGTGMKGGDSIMNPYSDGHVLRIRLFRMKHGINAP